MNGTRNSAGRLCAVNIGGVQPLNLHTYMGNTHDADVRALARNKRQICFHTLQTILYRCSNWLAAHYVGTVQMVEDLQTGPHVTYVIIGCVVPVSTKIVAAMTSSPNLPSE